MQSATSENIHLQTIEIANLACLRAVKLDLTPLHAFIGPNDSGKSTLLRAVRTLTQCLALVAQWKAGGINLGSRPLEHVVGAKIHGKIDGLACGVELMEGETFKLSLQYPGLTPGHFTVVNPAVLKEAMLDSDIFERLERNVRHLEHIRKPPLLLRLDADSLRGDSDLIPENEPVTFGEWSGQGVRGHRLPGILDRIINRGDAVFATIKEETKRLFPTVRNISLRNTSSSQKGLDVELINGQHVRPENMSEGLLYFLAYAALPYLAPASILLVEEPENGLHPARIRDVMKILKELFKTTQVLIATHSLLVVNELEADQVTIVTRDTEKGTQTRRLNETEDFAVRSKVYLPGELWLNYANGVDEADLLSPKKATP